MSALVPMQIFLGIVREIIENENAAVTQREKQQLDERIEMYRIQAIAENNRQKNAITASIVSGYFALQNRKIDFIAKCYEDLRQDIEKQIDDIRIEEIELRKASKSKDKEVRKISTNRLNELEGFKNIKNMEKRLILSEIKYLLDDASRSTLRSIGFNDH